MYYKVQAESVKYIDSMGRERRSSKNSIIYMEQRVEVKRLLKAKAIVQIADEDVAVDSDLRLVERSELPDREPTDKEELLNPDEDQEPADTSKPEEGSLVQAEIEDATLIGEVISIYKDKKIKVVFQGDSKKFRKMDADDLTVLD